MSSTRSAGRAQKRVSMFAISGLLAAVAMLIMAGMAMGAADPLKGGTVTLNLKLPKKVKVKSPGGGATVSGKTVTLPIGDPGGSLDPVFGSGTVEPGGTFVLKKGKKKVTLSELKVTFGGLYAGGNLNAKLTTKKKKKSKTQTSTLADITGGTVGRNGFGGTVDGAAMATTKDGAKKLNKALGLKKKLKNGKKNKKRFKKGKSLGTASTSTVPKTVQVVSGNSVTHGSTGFGKLAAGAPPACAGNPFPAGPGNPANRPCYGKGVNPIPGQGIIATGGASYTTPGGPITSPVVAGSTIAPDATAGMVKTGGTVQIKKTIPASFAYGAAQGAACDAAMPTGNFIQFTNTTNDFLNRNVLVDLTIKSPALGFPGASPFGTQIPSAFIDMAAAKVTANPATHKVDIVGFAARNANSAQIGLINGTFGSGNAPQNCGIPQTDAAIGDALFTVDLHMTTH